MAKFFIKIYNFFDKRKYLLFILLASLMAFAVASILNISIEEDISNFLPNNEKNKQINEIYQNINSTNKIFIFAKNIDTTNKNIDSITEAISFFAEELTLNDSLNKIKNILYEIDPEKSDEITSFITNNIPLFLSDSDYIKIDTIISNTEIKRQLEADKKILLSPAGSFLRNIILADPLFFSKNILEKIQTLQTNNNFTTENTYIFDTTQNAAVLIISPIFSSSDTYNNKLLAKDLENVSKTVKEKYPSVDISSFGAPLISVSNADRIKKDSLWTGIIAIVLIIAILCYFYKNLYDILLIVISILFGFVLSLAIVLVIKSSISIIIIGIATVIIGIAINYPIHLIAHYRHVENKQQLIEEIVSPLLIGNITTVAAFLSLIFLSSESMRSLGLFSSILLISTIFFVLIFLPHFLKKKKTKNDIIEKEEKNHSLFDKISNISPEKSKIFISIIFVLSIVFFVFSFGTSFEPDMHSINYMTEEQKEIMYLLSKNDDKNIETVISITEGENNEDALLAYNKANLFFDTLLANNLIEKKASINNFILSKKQQEEKIAKWNNFWKDKKENFINNFDSIAQKLNYNEITFLKFKEILNNEFVAHDIDYFATITENFGDNFISQSDEKTFCLTLMHVEKNKVDSLENIIKSFDEKTFCFDNSNFFKNIIETLSDDFNYILFVCSFVVFAFLLITFGRIELSIIAFLPLALAWFWILGIMNIFDIRFNIINIILATFIFGQGDDYTIFITEGLIYEYTYRKKFLQNFKTSIFISFLIMTIAIGLLIFAKHPALQSLGEVTVIGMISVLIMAYFIPPFFFRLLTTRKGEKRLMPITLWNFIKTIITFSGFIIGSIFMTLSGFVLLTILGNTKKHKEKYHSLLCVFYRLLIKLLPGVGFSIENKDKETFDKPAIIISNHQSHFDLMYTLSIHPKIIVLTKEAVQKNIFYGIIVHYADFISVADDLETNLKKIKEKVADGYSILVFPEGTRSEDCSIKRFHQGAFHLAKTLNLDIVPVVIHGLGHFFPKNEFILRKGTAHIEILKRFSNKEIFENNNSVLDVSKYFRKYLSAEYKRIARKNETCDYFKDLVYKNYIYKGSQIANEAKKALKTFDFKRVDDIPETGSLLIKNSANGEISLLIALVKKDLKIFAYDEDENKIAIAKNCISVPQNLSYISKIDISQKIDYILEI